jgi:lipid-binding SYLF domain-containing protein
MPRALLPLVALLMASSSPAAPPSTRDDLHQKVLEAIAAFRRVDASMGPVFASARAYAVFPSVGKGGFGLGGAHGNGELFEHGAVTGRTSLTQVTVGFQVGGQVYREVIFFEDPAALASFKKGHFALSAQVSAVAAAEGAAANAKYREGVLVFTLAKGGLMLEASVGGQKFSFKPTR